MQTRNLSNRFIAFVDHVQQVQQALGRELEVLDLRLECRAQRLEEYPDWPINELELIEQEAARYHNQTKLSQLISGEAEPNLIGASSWIDSPSPFAWT